MQLEDMSVTEENGTDDKEEEPGHRDEDELAREVRLSSPFCPTGSSSPRPVTTEWSPHFSTPIHADCRMSTDSWEGAGSGTRYRVRWRPSPNRMLRNRMLRKW